MVAAISSSSRRELLHSAENGRSWRTRPTAAAAAAAAVATSPQLDELTAIRERLSLADRQARVLRREKEVLQTRLDRALGTSRLLQCFASAGAGAATPPPEPACYLVFSETNSGSLYLHWSDADRHAPPALVPKVPAPRFKFTVNGGRFEICREVGGPKIKRFYEGWAYFAKTARAHEGRLTFLGDVAKVPVALYLNDEQSNVVRVRMGAAVSLEGVRAVAVAPALAVGFEALTMEARFFQQVGDRIALDRARRRRRRHRGDAAAAAENVDRRRAARRQPAPRSSSGEPPSPGKAWAGSARAARVCECTGVCERPWRSQKLANAEIDHARAVVGDPYRQLVDVRGDGCERRRPRPHQRIIDPAGHPSRRCAPSTVATATSSAVEHRARHVGEIRRSEQRQAVAGGGSVRWRLPAALPVRLVQLPLRVVVTGARQRVQVAEEQRRRLAILRRRELADDVRRLRAALGLGDVVEVRRRNAERAAAAAQRNLAGEQLGTIRWSVPLKLTTEPRAAPRGGARAATKSVARCRTGCRARGRRRQREHEGASTESASGACSASTSFSESTSSGPSARSVISASTEDVLPSARQKRRTFQWTARSMLRTRSGRARV